MNNVIQINRFAELHDGEKIIFCKTDFLLQEFEHIRQIKNDVILISGNSDYCITHDLVSRAPKNIKKWFCQNKLCDSNLLQSIPLGVENSIECCRKGHGVGWEHAVEKCEILTNPPNQNPTKLIFANFTVGTNPQHRNIARNKAIELEHITWKEPHVKYDKFVKHILEHEAVFCAQGNGPGDNHRIYETLYLSRVPITFSFEQYRHLHYMFPTLFLSNLEELNNEATIRKKIDIIKNKMNRKYLDYEYWKGMVLDYAKKI